jgi:SAM-dependent methyltransferase
MTATHAMATPSPWILRFADLVPPGARVLDVGAGAGRHARLFAARGAHVVAVDRDGALFAGYGNIPGIDTRACDLETGTWPFGNERFDAIVVVNYLHRPLFPHLRSALLPDAVLLYETFAMGNEVYGRPANPDFLLCPGELLSLAALAPAPLTVVGFEQGLVEEPSRRAVIQRLAAVGPARAWPPALAKATAPASPA